MTSRGIVMTSRGIVMTSRGIVMTSRQHARYVISSVGWELLGCDDVTWYCDDVTWYCDDVKTARTVYNQQCRLGIVRIMSGSAATLCLIDVVSIFVHGENFTRI